MSIRKIWGAINGWTTGFVVTAAFAQADTAFGGNLLNSVSTTMSGNTGRNILSVSMGLMGVKYLMDPTHEHVGRGVFMAAVGGGWLVYNNLLAHLV